MTRKVNMKNIKLHIQQDSGFKVPQHYFEGLEDSILAEAKLKNLVSDSGFKTPEGYLDNFKVSVIEETKIISLARRKNILFISSIAAAVVLFFSLALFKSTPLSISDLETATVDNYILNETEIGDLTTLFQDNELSETQFTESSLSDLSLESYLYNNSELEDLIQD